MRIWKIEISIWIKTETAIFVYNGKYFVDPGFVAEDSLGKTVDKLDRRITVQRMNKGLSINGLYDGNYVEKNIDILDQPSKYLFTENNKTIYVKGDIDSAFIRPDIYKMIYSFGDDNTHERVETARYVIVFAAE